MTAAHRSNSSLLLPMGPFRDAGGILKKCAALANEELGQLGFPRSPHARWRVAMPLVSADIPKSLRIALDQEIGRLRTDESGVVTAALSKYLGVPVHTLFQVSTSGALVAGVYDRAVTVKSILELGDFALSVAVRGQRDR